MLLVDGNFDKLNTKFTINGKEMFIRMMNEASKPIHVTLNAIKKLKSNSILDYNWIYLKIFRSL
jgi:hypothetical protein